MKTYTLFTPDICAPAGASSPAGPGPVSVAEASGRTVTVLHPLRGIATGALLSIFLAMGGLLAPDARAQEEPAGQMQVVNINTADAEELSLMLQGVGRARAEAIVQYREMYGPFESVEELMDVSGVGEATLARNRQAITLE